MPLFIYIHKPISHDGNAARVYMHVEGLSFISLTHTYRHISAYVDIHINKLYEKAFIFIYIIFLPLQRHLVSPLQLHAPPTNLPAKIYDCQGQQQN